MEEKVQVLFASSFENPNIIVVEPATVVGHYKDEEGNIIGFEYDGVIETWLARAHMSCYIYTVSSSSLPILKKKYTEFIKEAWKEPCDNEHVERLKEEFLQMVKE